MGLKQFKRQKKKNALTSYQTPEYVILIKDNIITYGCVFCDKVVLIDNDNKIEECSEEENIIMFYARHTPIFYKNKFRSHFKFKELNEL